MTSYNTFYLNSLELSPSNDIYLTSEVSFDPSSDYESSSAWHGTNVRVFDISAKSTKVVLKGFCTTEAALRSLAKYHITNYNWNEDSEDLYLIRDLSRRWKIYSFEFHHDYAWIGFTFQINLVLAESGSEGYVQTSYSGSGFSSSPIAVSSIVNAGDQNTLFDLVEITGSYSSGNLTNVSILQSDVGYFFEVADVMWDTAKFQFYNDYTAKYTYIDSFTNSTLFGRNKYSSANATFSSDHLEIAASGSVVFRVQLTHPLLQDPVLTLTLSSVVGSPDLEVSPDGTNWWSIEKSLISGSLIDYNLTKLAGYSEFYFRITTGASDSLNLYYMKLISWHNYSGQRPIPYIRANSVSETMNISFSAGGLSYDFRLRDKWSV